jgi:hypothetical protein
MRTAAKSAMRLWRVWFTLLWGVPSPPASGTALALIWSKDNVASLWNVRLPAHIPGARFSTFLLLCCWRLWKHRHHVAFRSFPPCYNRLFVGCREDTGLRACRLPHADRHVALAWEWAEVFPFYTSAITSVTRVPPANFSKKKVSACRTIHGLTITASRVCTCTLLRPSRR